ncbi:MAG: response regulator [Paludibacter sp.]|nr:response regulator [Paludibacter sp.]
MKKILIVEDEQRKLENIKEFLNKEFPEIEFVDKRSYISATKEIYEHYQDYDIILLDMSMTTYDVSVDESGGVPEPLAGANILDTMFLMDITTKVIVVTMYESFVGKKLSEFDIELKNTYPDNYIGFVFFSYQKTDWQIKLKKYITSLL